MKNILVPIDFSEKADSALQYAGQLAAQTGASVVLVHCAGTGSLTDTHHARLMNQLNSLSARVLALAGKRITVRHESVLLPGRLKSCLPMIADQFDAGLVVMSAQTIADDDNDAQMAATAAAIMQVGQCPVLVVPDGLPYKPFERLVFATDFTDQDAQVLQQIAGWAALTDADLQLVHVYNAEGGRELQAYKNAMAFMSKELNYPRISFHLLAEDDVLEGISEFAENQEADLVIMATQDAYFLRRLFNKSYLKTLAYHTRIPLLNLYQEKQNPCSGCCYDCRSKKAEAAQQAITID